MKHIFVINPYAGKTDSTREITERLRAFDGVADYEIYVTKCAGDGTIFVHDWCERHPNAEVRFYACGGDGTINEVVSGLIDYPWAQMSCYPCGSGNDYIKYYGTQEEFLDIQRLIEGEPHKVDVMKVSEVSSEKSRYSINVCNFGFEAAVCQTMINVKRKPFIGGKRAYTTGIVKAIFTSRFNHCNIDVDGEAFNRGRMLLCTLSNGQYVGGAYRCAPRSKNDDGLIEVCMFEPMPLLKFISLIGAYSRGEHLDNKRCAKEMRYTRGKLVEIAYSQPFAVCIDGEMLCDSKYRIEQLEHAATFVSPKKL